MVLPGNIASLSPQELLGGESAQWKAASIWQLPPTFCEDTLLLVIPPAISTSLVTQSLNVENAAWA